MKRKEVKSSNIKSIGYFPIRKKLEIEFKNDTIYRYKGVPKSVYKQMMNSESKGKFLNSNIKYQYPYRKHKVNGVQIKNTNWQKLEKKASYIIDYLYQRNLHEQNHHTYR